MIERSLADLNLVDVESPKALGRSMRALDEAVVAAVYDRFWGPEDAVSTVAAAFLDPFSYLIFPAGVGAANKATYNTPVPPVWRGGQVRPTLYYSGSVASAVTVINWRLLSDSATLGDVLGAVSVAHSVSVAGPAAVAKLCSTIFEPLTISITSGDRLLGVRVNRGAGDTYLGDAWFLGLLLQFFPARPST